MIIKNIEGVEIYKLLNSIDSWFNRKRGRFDVKLCVESVRYAKQYINITQVRLRAAKEFCGNHPAACEVGNPNHRKGKYLEGADWVQFNDELNNILDRMNVSARVESAQVIVRKGELRRTNYRHRYPRPGANAEWVKDSPHEFDWEDCRGIKKDHPVSEFNEGTPGVYRRANHQRVG